MSGFLAVLRRDLRLALSGGGEMLTLVLFFIIVGAITPFAVGPDRALLARIAPGVIWIAAFLAMLLGLDRLLRPDRDDGTLALYRRADAPLAAVLFAKVIAHWLTSALPLILAAPFLALILGMDMEAFWRTLLSLLLGTPALAAFGTFGAAITVAVRRGGLLAPILIAPLCVPVLIFGVGAIAPLGGPDQASAALLLLAALSLMATALSPFAAALAIDWGEE
ncbi:heme exporter protein CcmB [Devosia sp. XJ19-1]|uniref:Heme exporter protein B n=1 Tax=Devosia ureilytica TaxID=2952754 RepID=A0A9Q4AMD0_9HYPH|nr:heme exporter protein CcmB [Devosia ureilytica]MCP8882864.1 heme exporter protein CcmB [Devosia ureilytica]MCP8886768.1 heme exporter protein CcmB [Devosia ureilytica]